MITVKLLGGLGNQLFQYAYGVALQSKGYQVQFDKQALREGTHREYSLGYFVDIPFGEPTGPVLTEKTQRYNPDFLSPVEPATCLGYWQSEKYFKHVETEIRWALQFREPALPLAELIAEAKMSNSIALHVRRQDYVTLKHFHGMPGIEYYERALAFIERYADFSSLFVFSDDPDWCEQHFDGLIVRGQTKYEDLQLMSACKHAIIANSSFSWWGAWLGDSNPTDRMVITPKRWFADEEAEQGAADIVPERWIRL